MAKEECGEGTTGKEEALDVKGIHKAIESCADCGEDGTRDLLIIQRFLSDDVGDEAREKIEAILDEALATEGA